MVHRPLAATLLAPLLLCAAPAGALWLAASELQHHCAAFLNDDHEADASLCAIFIQGFLAGAATAESTVRDTVSGIAVQDGTFAERAVRTRIGSRMRPAARPDLGYCIDESVPPQAVIEAVAAHILRYRGSGAERGVDPPAQRLVHDALVAQFPCEAE